MPSSWLRQASLQSDIQKLLRYGKKLPDKLNIFYKVSPSKDNNRLCHSTLSERNEFLCETIYMYPKPLSEEIKWWLDK